MPADTTALDLDPSANGGSRAEALVSLVRLRWFINRRWAMLLLLWAFLGVEAGLSGRWIRPAGLIWPLLALFVLNLLWIWFSQSLQRRITCSGEHDVGVIRLATFQANAQIALDLFLLTAIIRYTGGIENPMAVFYLFHMAIASLLLTGPHAIMQGCWAFILYSVLGLGELHGWFRPHYELLTGLPAVGLYHSPRYVYLALLVIGSGIFGSLYFTLRVTARLQEREQALRRLNWALQCSQAALQELQRRKAQFMRTAAHQLKSPLAVIQTQVHLLRDTPMPDEKRRQIYDKVITRCRVAIDQVTDLLTFARVQEAVRDRPATGSTDVAKIIHELYERNQPVAESRGLEFICDIPSNGAWLVPIEETDLSDAIGNLLENALKYTDKAGRVAIRLAKTEDRIAVTVQDTGMGMALDTQREMFDAYRRGNRALEKGVYGSGLGLSIVRAVMEQTGGEIIVKSRPDEGSAFTLLLPTREAKPELPAGQMPANVVRIE